MVWVSFHNSISFYEDSSYAFKISKMDVCILAGANVNSNVILQKDLWDILAPIVV